ncbi:hypothetical protein [Mesorhizobium sp. B2-4-6]|uniref:hypothetical protein n=1 Tax=Mesorhizobium sp. B2-4-6 TaxID=2589943 RepID=UPI0015E45340|nr:hypothetical protein [Mesorhizobium sp. B2-4-6]
MEGLDVIRSCFQGWPEGAGKGYFLASNALASVRDIWSFSAIWQDFGRNRCLYQRHHRQRIRPGTTLACCRNVLLTIDVLHFLSIDAETPSRRGTRRGATNRSEPPMTQLCGRRRITTLSAGMMPFGKIEKSLHEGR